MRLESPKKDSAAVIRGVRRTLTYAGALLWTLGLGVGANAVMFWIVDQLLSRSP